MHSPTPTNLLHLLIPRTHSIKTDESRNLSHILGLDASMAKVLPLSKNNRFCLSPYKIKPDITKRETEQQREREGGFQKSQLHCLFSLNVRYNATDRFFKQPRIS